MVHSKRVGDIAEAYVLAALVARYMTVLIPFGENQRFDFVFEDDNGVLRRVQAKNGRLRNGVIKFNTASSTVHHRTGKREGYTGQIEFFGVYCPDLQKCYLVPVDLFGSTGGTLRINPTRNSQTARVKWAQEYELPS